MKSRTSMWMTVVYLFAALAMPVWTAAQDNPSPDHKHKHHQYKLIDIGTFGGPNSSVPVLQVQVLNNSGVVAGCADTSTPDPNYPNFNPSLGPDPFIQHAFRWKNGVQTDLGALPGVNSSCVSWITQNGLIVGGSENGVIDPLEGFPDAEAVLWKDGQVINLGTLGGYDSFALGANSRGQVVGAATNNVPDPSSGFGTQIRAFLWQNGVMQDLGTLGGPDAFAQAVNERGQVFGASSAASGPGAGVLWDHGTLQAIPDTLGGTIVSPFYLNNQGQAIGTATTAGDMFNHPFIWYRGVMTDLGTFGGDNGSPSWVNDEGEVVGEADFPGDQVHHAFLWKDSKLTDLGTANGAPCSNAFAINSGRQIVGNSTNCHGMVLGATLWENGSAVDLNTLIPPGSSLHLRDAVDVNDDGEIAGIGDLANGDQHAFLLIPCDDKHPGECEDYSMIEVADTATAPKYPAAMQSTESPTETVQSLRSLLRQPYHVAGQPTAPRD